MLKNHFDTNNYVFFVPDEGLSQLVTLHDNLYKGVVASFLRTDIAYIPHMTLGYSNRLEHDQKACNFINSENIEMAGSINQLTLLQSEHNSWKSIREFNLVS